MDVSSVVAFALYMSILVMLLRWSRRVSQLTLVDKNEVADLSGNDLSGNVIDLTEKED